MAFWFNVRTQQVEEDGATSPKEDLMGPYTSREEAQSALDAARARTEQWDAEDEAWEERGERS